MPEAIALKPTKFNLEAGVSLQCDDAVWSEIGADVLQAVATAIRDELQARCLCVATVGSIIAHPESGVRISWKVGDKGADVALYGDLPKSNKSLQAMVQRGADFIAAVRDLQRENEKASDE